MIEVRNLTLRLGKSVILDDVSFCLERGGITLLLGRNGSGKTSIARTLSSYYRRYEGSILFDGVDLKGMNAGQRRASHAVLNQFSPSLEMSVAELFETSSAPSPFSLPDARRKEKAISALKEMGVEEFYDRRLSTLSGGERQLVYLALLLAREARLYILDEPESHLDQDLRRKTEKVLKLLASRDSHVLLISHDINRSFPVCTDIIALDKGHVVFSGSREDFLSRRIYESLFSLEVKRLSDEEGKSILLFF